MLFFILLVLAILLYIYHPWFTFSETLSSGDWPYLFLENINEFSFLPEPHDIWLSTYYKITAKILVEYLGFSWALAERIFWFWPMLLLSALSAYKLTKSWIGVLIYTANTYVLMLAGGGQMGVAMAYSIAPLVLARFIRLISAVNPQRLNFKLLVASGLVLAVQIMFDPRIAYIAMIAVLIYFVVRIRSMRHVLSVFLSSLLVPILIALVLNGFWIIGMLIHGLPGEPVSGFTKGGVDYFSFASFPQTFSLLHPNWPENIFGKTYFLKPEFLALPILAFSSLLFFNKNSYIAIQPFNHATVLFFALLGLLGAFLAKGSNPPFGQIYLWLFDYFPGFFMFRDPTKFYLLVALSYSFLLSFSVNAIYDRVISNIQFKFKIYFAFLLFTTCYLLFLIRPALLGQLSGTFKPHTVPGEYVELKDYLHSNPKYFQTLWIPARQRFGFSSKNHPALSGTDYFDVNSPEEVVGSLMNASKDALIRDSSLRYIIVPNDVQGELFVTERTYDENKRLYIIEKLQTIPWLSRKADFGKIAVFEVQ